MQDEAQERAARLIADAVPLPSREMPMPLADITLGDCLDILTHYPYTVALRLNSIVVVPPGALLEHVDGISRESKAAMLFTTHYQPGAPLDKIGTLRILYTAPYATAQMLGDLSGAWDLAEDGALVTAITLDILYMGSLVHAD